MDAKTACTVPYDSLQQLPSLVSTTFDRGPLGSGSLSFGRRYLKRAVFLLCARERTCIIIRFIPTVIIVAENVYVLNIVAQIYPCEIFNIFVAESANEIKLPTK